MVAVVVAVTLLVGLVIPSITQKTSFGGLEEEINEKTSTFSSSWSRSRGFQKGEKQSEIEGFGNWVLGKEIYNNVKGENFVGFSMQMKKKGRQRVKGYWFTES
ncbi:unnamed protein product, partial [Prunus brigantina]